jgi:alpha-L-rhamnosidase
MKKLLFTLLLALPCLSLFAENATWIWYPGDYEIWLGNDLQNRRTERGTFFPPFWKVDTHYPLVEFSTEVNPTEDETITILAEGKYNVKLDGKFQQGMPSSMVIPAGKHQLNIKVFCLDRVPALFVDGKTIQTGPAWKTTFEDKEWIDESGKASDKSGTTYLPAGKWNFNLPENAPSKFHLPTLPMSPVTSTRVNNGLLVDFGKETFGFPFFHGLTGKGKINVYYGESKEEALDTKRCELLDVFDADAEVSGELLLTNSKAFRYLYIETEGDLAISSVDMKYEFNPLEYKGSFKCSDTLINHIWNVSAYTLQLTSREFFIDGIKRDRWVWSGDAYQSFLMNYYLFNDNPTVQRTLMLLRGKDPVSGHINTIMDYTFYWFMGLYDYYMYTGDKEFIRLMYPRMQSLMNWVLSRRNSRGLLEGQAGDWIFIDWTDKPMDKKGEVSFEQLLYCRSLETMALCANLLDKQGESQQYADLALNVKTILMKEFWDKGKGAFIHNKVNGMSDGTVTRYTNMFAIFFNYLTEKQKEGIKEKVILNDNILKISTPYMRFYELEAMCSMGETNYVMQEMRNYWGGMLQEGATTFWEKYNPQEKGTEHLAMYSRPYGKSLCHGWGASPIYLLGKYYLGVKPTAAGYATFEIRPELGDLKWMEGSVPTPHGSIKVYKDLKSIRVTASEGSGYLFIKAKKPKTTNGKLEKVESGLFRLPIVGNGQEVTVNL